MGMDGTAHFHDAEGNPLGGVTRLGTFSNYLVCHEMQTVKLPEDIPFELACLASCGVATGFGAAVNGGPSSPATSCWSWARRRRRQRGPGRPARRGRPRHRDRPRRLQAGAGGRLRRHRGYASIPERPSAIDHLTNGQGVDVGDRHGRPGRRRPSSVRRSRAVGKSGTCVLGVGRSADKGIAISPQDFTNFAKHIQGVMYGNCNPTADIPRLLQMYKDGTSSSTSSSPAATRSTRSTRPYADMHAGTQHPRRRRPRALSPPNRASDSPTTPPLETHR